MRRLGKLNCLEHTGADDAPWVILFHGYGADAKDLAPLAEVIPVANKNLNWLFPDGFLEVPIGPSWMGKAWWPVDMMELQRAAMTGVARDLSKDTPAGLNTAFEKAMELLKALKVPWDKIILGGFSQGAMLATELYLHAPETPKGLIIMSGTLLHADKLRPLVPQRAGQNFFLSHGERDEVLSIQGARRLETLLTQGGMKGRLVSFNGGHEIPMGVIQGVGNYINSLA
jgi:phospholipase/carboxylesterase